MPVKKSKAKRLEAIPASRDTGSVIQWVSPCVPKERMLLRASTTSVRGTRGNQYLCALERNQSGKYNVRVLAYFGSANRDGSCNGDDSGASRTGWKLPVYFLASSFNAAMKKLEESLQHLQKNEARLRFWGLERTDDPNVAGELLQEFGLWLDRRRDFPRKRAEVAAALDRPINASTLAAVRRVLADSLSQERSGNPSALAGD